MENPEKTFLTPDYQKDNELTWEDRRPSVVDLLSAIEKKFPGVSLDSLEVEASGEDSSLLTIRKRGVAPNTKHQIDKHGYMEIKH